MTKIEEILRSYHKWLTATEEEKEVAKKRLDICMGCEHWGKNALGIERCKLCGCQMSKKVFSPKGEKACPEKKWTI